MAAHANSVSQAVGQRPHLVIAYRRPEPVMHRFSLRDRTQLLDWAEQARAHGVCRVSLERPEPQDEAHIGEFALIYDARAEWATWAVACEPDAYLLWSPNTGKTLGRFPTVGAALAAICAPAC